MGTQPKKPRKTKAYKPANIPSEVEALTPPPVTENFVVEVDPKLKFFTPSEQERILDYINSGLPQVMRLDDITVARIRDMYVEGFNYNEISQNLNLKKDIVLYCAYKFDFPDIKNKRLSEIGASLNEKYAIARLDSATFVTELIQFWHQYYREKIEKYRRSKDDRIVDTMDLKHLDKYFKAVELLEKMMGKAEAQPQIPVISLPEGGTVKSDGNTITVTPDREPVAQSVGEALKILAELKEASKKE